MMPGNQPGSSTPLSPLKQAFLALEQAQARIHELESDRQQPIAIVGIGCRIPGQEAGVDGFRKLLWEQRCAVSDGVETRLSDSLGAIRLPASARNAALLADVDLFDPRHFGISPREAAGMDPQQRLLLEVVWEALEHAAIDPLALYQSATGVYVGISSHDYAQLQLRAGDPLAIDPHFASGGATSVAAGRISYVLGLNGPCLAVDTACSSSLVAVHLACEALRHGECSLALAGGVNLILSPEPSVAFAQAGMLSDSGVCRAFDALADGFVRGEGCGVLVLKRLSLAQRDGDRIVGVILGSAVNQDGASSGLTVPNGLAQQALLREAHRRAGIEAWQVGYVEAHGTGTSLGDPIEAEALGAVFGEGRPRERKLPIGSVKTNIGHLESAAGVAGLIKLLLGLEHGMVPAQLHWERPSEHVRWSELPLEVVTAPRAWEPIAGRRIGGVSSFGFSGTNAHVIVEGWPRTARLISSETSKPAEPREEVLLITARTEAALRALVERYAAFLPGSGADWSDICYTSAVGRAVFAQRLAVVTEDKGQAAAKLLGWLRGESVEGVFHGVVSAGSRAGGEALDPAATNAEIAAQFVRGVVMDWAARFADRGLHRVALPTYAFQRERYWIEAPSSPQAETGEPTGQALLGRRLPVAGVRAQFASVLSAEGWIGEHVVQGRVVLPATGHLELMLEAGVAAFAQGCALEDVVLQSPLTIDGRRRVQTVVEEESGGRSRVRLYAEAKAEETKEAWERVSEGWLLRDAIHAQPSEILELEAIRDRLQPRHAEQSFYAEMSARGLEFGERFRGVRQLWSGAAEALGEIVEIDSATSGFQVPPWWLDACLQVAGAIGGGEDDSLYLPMSLGRIDVYPDPHPTAASVRQRHAASTWSHITTQRIDAETLVANVTVTDQEGHPILHIANLRFRKLSTKTADIASWMYRLDWQQQDLVSAAQEGAISQVAAELDGHAARWADTEEVSQYGFFFAELEALSAAYVIGAFAQLGWPQIDVALSPNSLQQRWKIAPQHERLFLRLLEIAGEGGAIRGEFDSIVFGPAPAPMDASRVTQLLHRFPFGGTELELVARCGRHLAEVLTGKMDGGELVFPRGQSEEMLRLYRDSVPARMYNEMVAKVVARVVSARGGEASRILEVGGGTGATTDFILQALKTTGQEPVEYLFTDVSPLLTRRASQTFASHAFLRTQVLDLERDGAAQGVNGPFTIMVAVNVLHATANLSATLDRLKTLLAPDGVLILVEVIGKQRWADITVGLLNGWWNAEDRWLRPDYPALKSGAWKPLLQQAGFRSVLTIPNGSDQQSIFARQELIVASELAQPRTIGIVGQSPQAESVALQLRQRGAVVHSVAAAGLGSRIRPEGWDAVLWMSETMEDFDAVAPGCASSSIENSVSSLLATAKALSRQGTQAPLRLYVVTSGGCNVGNQAKVELAATPLLGLATALASEAPEMRCTRLDCCESPDHTDAAWIASEVLTDGDEDWIAWREGKRYLARLERFLPPTTAVAKEDRVQLKAGTGIEKLEYVPILRRELQPDEVELQVHATALNFRDVLQSLGVVQLDAPLGTDCAGVVLRVGAAVTDLDAGDEVLAIAPGCFASHAIAPRALVIRKPDSLSLAQGAAQSIAYLTADYCLTEVAKIQSGERVLIHAAAGGVGLAAVYLCQRAGARVVATAGSEKKRAFLRSLGIAEVYDSRSLQFAEQISGQLDVILNSIAGDAVDAGLGLLRPGGRFLELGKTDLRDPLLIGKQWPHIRYLPVDLTPLFAARSPWVGERLSQLLNSIAEGSLPALPVTSFDSADVTGAFRSMARGEHIGRIVVERKHARPFRGVHLITGGLRGIGLKLAEWLAENGARGLVLVGRRAPDEAAADRIARLRATGVSVHIVNGDISEPDIAVRAIQATGIDLRGVWHSAGVLDHAPIQDQTWESMRAVFRPKVDGAWNLHRLTHAIQLDCFVLFSSWASIGGSHGQANHCAANAFLDGLAHFRRAKGLPALSVNWGAWGETGAAAGDAVGRQLARSGMESMAPGNALEALRMALVTGESQIAVAAIQWPRYLSQRSSRHHRRLYADILSRQEVSRDRETRTGTAVSLSHTRLTHDTDAAGDSLEAILALPLAMRQPAMLRITTGLVRRTLDLHAEEAIDPDVPFSDMGMDSLLAIELRNSLSGVLQKQFPSTILFDYPTLRALVEYLSREILNEAKPPSATPPVPAIGQATQNSLDILDTIEQMSDDEVESWFQ